MFTRRMTPAEKFKATVKFVGNRVRPRPALVTIEMTKHCNAGCDFCDDWKTKHSPPLGDVVDMVRRLNPMVLALTGGEPLLEKRLAQIVRDVKKAQSFVYVFTVTNGSLLSEERALELIDAGIDQISISLNYLDERQDTERKIPGLWRHLSQLIPRIAQRGCTILANTVIMRDNLDQILPIAEQMHAWGAGVSYSCYTHFKNGNRGHYFPVEELPQLERVVAGVIAHKKRVGNVTNSAYYLERIVPYFRSPDGIPGCKAGNTFVQLTPDGQVRQCADFAPFVHYSEYRGMEPTPCTRCWYACRGESEASFDFARLSELAHRT